MRSTLLLCLLVLVCWGSVPAHGEKAPAKRTVRSIRLRELVEPERRRPDPAQSTSLQPRAVRRPVAARRVPAATAHVPCAVQQAVRPRDKERGEVLRAIAALDRGARPSFDAVRRAFPYTELQSLVSGPVSQAPARRRLAGLLAQLDALSLDPQRAAATRDPAVASLHARLRNLVSASVPPGLIYTPAYPNDLAATAIFGTLDNWKPVKWVLRVHVVACSDANGQHKSTMTKAQVQQGIELAVKVFEPAQIRLVFDPAKDWEEVKNTQLNQWDDLAARAFVAKPALRNKIVLFSAWGPDAQPNGWAANGGTHIWMSSGGGDAACLCHEVGHFLGNLGHTFPGPGNQLIYGDLSKVTAENVDSVIANFIYDPSRNTSGVTTEQALDGDTFADTAPDPGNDYWEKKYGPGSSCDGSLPTATVPNPKGGPPWVFTPDRANLMSYFFRCPPIPTLTSQQAAAILGRLEGTVPQPDGQNLRRLIETQNPFAASSGDVVLVGKIQNVGTSTSSGGRTAVLESVVGGQATALGAPTPIPPLAPGDWVYIKVPMPGGAGWNGRARLSISPGDQNAANDTYFPEPYQAPIVK